MQTISKTLLGVAVFALTMIASDVLAQPGGGGRRGGEGGGAPSAADFLDRFDTDKDGKLTKEELPERMQRIMDQADADKDGSVSKDELDKMFAQRSAQGGGRGGRGGEGRGGEGGRGGRGAGGPEGGRGGPGSGGDFMKTMMLRMPIIAALDADKDGEISEAEIKNAVAALKKLDKNSDGKLAGDEITPEFGRGGPGGGGGRGGRGGGEFGGRGGRGGPGGGDGGGRGDRPQRPTRPE